VRGIGLALAALAALGGCATADTAVANTSEATYLIVRHAEKADASRDPGLSVAGIARAQALARRVGDADVVAVYATAYRRTRETVQPFAAAHGLAITPYDAGQPATGFAGALRAAHPRGTVLVAGHSNTVPAIVSALCGCDSASMADHEYDRLSIVRIGADGHPRLAVERYGAPSAR
jgi:broad specificity phosphatase PhoE